MAKVCVKGSNVGGRGGALCILCKKYLATFQSELRSKFLPGEVAAASSCPGRGKDVAAGCKKWMQATKNNCRQ